jgi:hypothetical protein
MFGRAFGVSIKLFLIWEEFPIVMVGCYVCISIMAIRLCT